MIINMNIKLQKISCDDNLCEQIISQINNDLDDNIGSNTYLLNTNKDNFNINFLSSESNG